MNPQFLAIAKDPAIIPGVYHYCDEWCDYCALTTRCLEYRCTTEFRRQQRRSPGDPTFLSTEEAIAFTREVAAAEGTRTDGLDALLARPRALSNPAASHPLARMAWEYAIGASELMMPAWIEILKNCEGLGSSAPGPGPDEIVMWYHLRIYMKIFRALAAPASGAGDASGTGEAVGCAKLALVSVQRSRSALRLLRSAGNGAAVDALIARLDALESGLDAHFPEARAFVRVGLDCAVA
uniref:Uncharacterized protein n=1 Tax=uncultured bacterium 59 TaxID=698390 RepID=E3T6G0_9BACT|nr:hypothetical protein [uncultured bacterium 59]